MAKKESPEGKKSKTKPIIIVLVILLVLVGIVICGVPGLSLFNPKKETSNGIESVAAPEEQTATDKESQKEEEEGPYKGWQKYRNKNWGIYARYPAGWTKNETPNGQQVTFLGPPTPAGGVILNECSFSIFVESLTPATPLEAYVNTARSAPQGGGDITKQTETDIDGNVAIQIVDTYVDVGQPWKRMRFWTKKNGKAYTFSFAASPNYNKTDYYVLHETEAEQIKASIVISKPESK